MRKTFGTATQTFEISGDGRGYNNFMLPCLHQDILGEYVVRSKCLSSRQVVGLTNQYLLSERYSL